MKKQTVFIGFILLVAMALSGCGSSNSDSNALVGNWEFSSITQPASYDKTWFIGYEFNEDGTLKVYNGGDLSLEVKEYKWTVNKDHSNIIDLSGADGNFQMKYLIDQDGLRIGDAQYTVNQMNPTYKKMDQFSFSDLIEPDSRQSDLTAEQVVTELKNKGLPIGETLVVTEENDSPHLLGTPNQYTSKAFFADMDLSQSTDLGSTPLGGSIEVYANSQDASSKWWQYVNREGTNMKETNTKDKNIQVTSSPIKCYYRIGNIIITLDSVDFHNSGARTKVSNYIDALLEINNN